MARFDNDCEHEHEQELELEQEQEQEQEGCLDAERYSFCDGLRGK